jgi:transcriptional regulator with XRE-family HTH domain
MTSNPTNPLAERLKAARRIRMTQQQLAEAAGWVPSKISKIESGRQIPTEQDLETWGQYVASDSAEVQAWIGMLEQARAQHERYSELLRAGQAATQMDYQRMVETSTVFRFYEKAYVPLFLQTPAYSRASLEQIKRIYQPEVDLTDPSAQEDLDKAVAARQASATQLFDTGRQFEFILDEAVLRTWRYSPELWRSQLMRIAGALDLPNVRLGILQLDAILPIFNTSSFEIYGDVVSVETFLSDSRLVQSEDVDAYQRQMDQLWDAAVTGQRAAQLIERARRLIPHPPHP